jgi:hypothetical protein
VHCSPIHWSKTLLLRDFTHGVSRNIRYKAYPFVSGEINML